VRQLDLDRWAALKILSDDLAEDSSFAERLIGAGGEIVFWSADSNLSAYCGWL